MTSLGRTSPPSIRAYWSTVSDWIRQNTNWLYVAAITIIACLFFFVASKVSNSTFWSGFFCNTSSSLFVLGFGISIVNIYIDKASKKRAVRALQRLTVSVINTFLEELNNSVWAQLGKSQWDNAVRDYSSSEFKPKAIKSDIRKAIYNAVKAGDDLKNKSIELGETLAELTILSGWSFNPKLLESCIDARIAIKKLRDICFDDSQQVVDSVTASIIDIYGHSNETKRILQQIAGELPEKAGS